MMNRRAYEAVDRTFRDIMGTVDPRNLSLLFGGKVVVLGGDFRQILPVVIRGLRGDIIDACLKRSPIWQGITVLHLEINMRVQRLLQQGLPADRAQHFASYLQQLGEGKIQVHPEIGEDMIRVPSGMLCPTENVDDLITLMYGDLNAITDPTERTKFIVNRAILTPKNVDVDQINSRVSSIFNATDGNAAEHSYRSADSVLDTDHAHLYPVEFLNSLQLSGVPPHEL